MIIGTGLDEVSDRGSTATPSDAQIHWWRDGTGGRFDDDGFARTAGDYEHGGLLAIAATFSEILQIHPLV